MRKIFLLSFFSLIFFSSDIFAQIMRSTSFDDRSICEQSKGVWREFGNGCVDECNAKFDQFSVCTQAATFGCDCGADRCWDGAACVTLQSYKKVFEIEEEEKQKKLAESKKERQQAAKENEQSIMEKFADKMLGGGPSGEDGGVGSSNNFVQFYNKILGSKDEESEPSISPAPTAQKSAEAEPVSPITVVPQEAPPIVIDTGNAQIPAAFLKRAQAEQEAAQRAAEQASKSPTVAPVVPLEVKKEEKPVELKPSESAPPGLPVIPLPN